MAKTTRFTPGVFVNPGDKVTNSADSIGGFHVVLKDHAMSGDAPKPGESNDLYHYSIPPGK